MLPKDPNSEILLIGISTYRPSFSDNPKISPILKSGKYKQNSPLDRRCFMSVMQKSNPFFDQIPKRIENHLPRFLLADPAKKNAQQLQQDLKVYDW